MKEFRIRIENIVASASLGVEVAVERIASKIGDVEYEPEQFPGVVYRLKEPKAAALIFGSGKVVCTGARSLKDVNEAFRKVVKAIERSGTKVSKNFKIEIENIVASTKLEGRLNLDLIAFNLENSEYEPEQFPGLVYRLDEPKVVFLLFGSGKVVCTGARKIQDVQEAVKKLAKKLKDIKAIVS